MLRLCSTGLPARAFFVCVIYFSCVFVSNSHEWRAVRERQRVASKGRVAITRENTDDANQNMYSQRNHVEHNSDARIHITQSPCVVRHMKRGSRAVDRRIWNFLNASTVFGTLLAGVDRSFHARHTPMVVRMYGAEPTHTHTHTTQLGRFFLSRVQDEPGSREKMYIQLDIRLYAQIRRCRIDALA